MNAYTFAHSVVHGLVRRCGYRLERSDRIPNCTLDLLGMAIASEVSSGRKFYFVQIGANDGLADDPLHAHILKWHLPGLLVEPLPDVFEQLVRNYSGNDQLSFENCAVCRTDGAVILHRPVNHGGRENAIHQKTSLNKANVLKHAGVDDVIEVSVPGMSCRSLFRKHRIEAISLLLIDAEGSDLDILEQVFDAAISPRVVQIETRHLCANDKYAFRSQLSQRGYKYVETYKDTLAVLESR